MSSRQEEKEQRKQERLAREAAAAKAAKRKRLLQLLGGVVVACAIVAGVVFAISNGGDEKADAGGAAVNTEELQAAAKAAGCTYRAFPSEGQGHESKEFTKADYKTNPPTSGDHVPAGLEAKEGIYAPGNEPGIGNWVHTLEHGRVLFQYKPGIDASVVAQLDKLFNEDVADSGGGYHSVLMRNNSQMPFEVAAVAWRHYMGCEKFSTKAIDAMRLFREELVDTAPEKIP